MSHIFKTLLLFIQFFKFNCIFGYFICLKLQPYIEEVEYELFFEEERRRICKPEREKHEQQWANDRSDA